MKYGKRLDALVLFILLAGMHLLYAKTWRAGFVTDFTGLQERLDGAQFLGFLDCFGFPALHQVTNFFLYFFYKWFSTNVLPWYLVFTSLHVANGFLGWRLGKSIFAKAGFDQPEWPALMGCLFFFFNPYQAEAVVWKVCFNFLFSSFLILSSLLFLVRWLEHQRFKDLFWSQGLFVVSLFTFELAIAWPFLAVALALWWRSVGVTQSHADTKAALTKLLLPSILALGVYFSLNKLLFGGWVGHYGEAVHLHFDLKSISANALKYFLKYLLFWRDQPHAFKESLQLWCERPVVAWSFLALCVAILMAFLLFFKKTNPKLRTVGLLWVLFFVALLPVVNLYVAYVLHGENDRYGYLASLFFYMGLAALLYFLPKLVRWPVFVAILCLSIFYLHRTTVFWKEGSRIFYSLLDGFEWQEAEEVYVLAFPENYQGIPIFKDFSKKNLALKHALKYAAGKVSDADFYQIAQFNMTTPKDGVTVQIDSTGAFSVQFNQWGNWWWRNGIGTGDYQTPQYSFKVNGNGSLIDLKKPGPGAVVIWSSGGRWELWPPSSEHDMRD